MAALSEIVGAAKMAVSSLTIVGAAVLCAVHSGFPA